MLVTFNNPSIEGNQSTSLTQSVSASGTTIYVEDTSGFSANDYVVVGVLGAEKTEIKKLSTVASTTSFTIGAVSHDHPQGTPISLIYFNKIDIQYKTSAAGVATSISGMPISLQVDRDGTLYNHTSGAPTYYYRARFFNEYTSQYSDWSSWFLASGPTRNTALYMTQQASKLARDPNNKVATFDEIVQFINDGQEMIESMLPPGGWWFTYAEDSTSLTTVDGTYKYALPADFRFMKDLQYHYDNGTNEYIYPLQWLPELEFQTLIQDQGRADSDDVRYYTISAGDATNPQGYFKVYPTPGTTGRYFPIKYFKKLTDLSDPADETLVPMPRALIYYAVAQIYFMRREEEEKGTYWLSLFEQAVGRMKMFNNRKLGQPDFIIPRGGRRGLSTFRSGKKALDIVTLRTDYF